MSTEIGLCCLSMLLISLLVLSPASPYLVMILSGTNANILGPVYSTPPSLALLTPTHSLEHSVFITRLTDSMFVDFIPQGSSHTSRLLREICRARFFLPVLGIYSRFT